MLTRGDLAKELGVQVATIQNYLNHAKTTIEGVKVGRRVYFDQKNADLIRAAIKSLKGTKVVYGTRHTEG